MLRDGLPCRTLSAAEYDQHQRSRILRRLRKRAASLGFELVDLQGGFVMSAPRRAYSRSTRMECPGGGGRVGWQRQRAWIEVFSPAEITYSSGRRGWCAQVRANRSDTAPGPNQVSDCG